MKDYEPLYGKVVALYYREENRSVCYFRGTITRETDTTIMIDVQFRHRIFYNSGAGGKFDCTPARCVIIPKRQIVYVMDQTDEIQNICPACGNDLVTNEGDESQK